MAMDQSVSSRVERLGPESMKWTRVTDTNNPALYYAAVECEENIYVVRNVPSGHSDNG